MRYIIYFVSIIGLTVIFIGLSTIIKEQTPSAPTVKNGVLDLSKMEDVSSSIINLDGKWDFYWQTFLHSETSEEAEPVEKTSIIVPRSWEEAGASEANITNIGYGTYKLQIIIPEEHVDQTFGIYIPSVATAYKLWIDDELITTNGTIGTSKKDMVPVNYAKAAYFQPDESTIDVVIEVSNFSQRKGGLWESLQFGRAENISLLKEKNIALQLLVVGSLIIMGIYNIFVFLLRRNLLYSMFLGVLCLLFAMRTLLIGETYLLHIIPSFPWELQVKIEYLPTVLGLPLLVRYANELYPEDKIEMFEKFVLVISAIFALIVLMTPAIVYTKYLIVFLIVVPLTLIYFGYIFLKAFFKKRPASLFTLIGFTIFIVTLINDSLYFLNFVSSGSYSSTGFLIFILSQTFVHAIQFSEANYQVEKLSNELLEANRSLEKKVRHRTQELALLYSKLRKSENERKNLMSDLAHELSKPLTLIKGYSEAMIDDKLPPQRNYLQIINEHANISERLIHDLSELSKLETRQMEMVFQKVKAKEYPKNIFQHHRWTVESLGKSFQWLERDEWNEMVEESTYLYLDRDRMNQVFMNIIDNALHYTENGQNIYMEVEWKPTAQKKRSSLEELTIREIAATEKNVLLNKLQETKIGEVIIKIIDEGEGISKEEIPFIFNRLYRGLDNRGGNKSRGLGLAISKEIIEMHGGKIWAESDVGKGSVFYISLPAFHA